MTGQRLQKNLGGNQEGDESKPSRMLNREQHLGNGRFSAGVKTSEAARRKGLELHTGQEDSRKQSCWSDNKALCQSSYQLRMQQQREGCARASELQKGAGGESRDPLRLTAVQWEIAVAKWPRGSKFRERVGNEYVIGATQSFTTTDGKTLENQKSSLRRTAADELYGLRLKLSFDAVSVLHGWC